MRRFVWVLLAIAVVAAGIGMYFGLRPGGCRSARKQWGLAMATCPSGKLRQVVDVTGRELRRGARGEVALSAHAMFTTDAADVVEQVAVRDFQSITLALVDATGVVTPLASKWVLDADETASAVELPEVPDGEYRLRATYATRVDHGEIELPLALYTPARIHVLTDRPLYEPGNTVQFRAVVLRARDLAPLDHRPGAWEIEDPAGDVLLRELAPAGEWGVVAGTFPLDRGAAQGTWHVRWRSGDAVDDVPFTVEPFTLPRFHVDASAERTFYRPGEVPKLRGTVVYSSGAPVSAARLALQWSVLGEWPPSPEWTPDRLPAAVVATAAGRFEVPLPAVPADLVGRVTVTARISAVDAAGDRVEGVASVLLSQEGIQVAAVTELGDGLVQGFNNRLFVRVSTPDGRVLANTPVTVKRSWDPTDRGTQALLDEDGVASLQIDPGAPVNIVIPALPWRRATRDALVTRGEPEELVGDDGAGLADQVEMDRWLAALAPCGKWYDAAGGDSDEDESASGTGATVGLRVSSGGAITAVAAGRTPLDRCVAAVVRTKHLPPGRERMYAVPFEFADPGLPSVTASVEDVRGIPDGVEAQLRAAAASARDCVPATEAAEGSLARALTWSVKAGSKTVTLGGWIADPNGSSSVAVPCVMARLAAARIALAEPAATDSMGLVRFMIALPASDEAARPQPTVMLGYELEVTADPVAAGTTTPTAKLRVKPGTVPDLRMRVTPILARVGEPITAELIRGPAYSGTLPKELELACGKTSAASKLDATTHSARFVMPAGSAGWCTVSGGGVHALAYVRPESELAVTVTPKQDHYAPGQQAELVVHTAIGGKGAQAAVGLFGVDASLGQLAPLPEADAMARLQPTVTTTDPAFGTLDGQALALGRIRGANAAAATVLRVSAVPSPPDLDATVSGRAATAFDPIEELTASFYRVLAELHVQARAWEATAPPTELMQPATMARLWSQALRAVEARHQPVVDAYGRRLRLSLLPPDLLQLTDPRYVVVVATRLPMDVENWTRWVEGNKP